jgi:hypothetical protein
MSLPAKKGGALIGAMAISTALATGGMNGLPVANATCFSAFGLNNGNGCTSNLTSIAIAIGPGATADASTSLFSSAIAVGENANAVSLFSAFTGTNALGNHATASALFGVLSTAFQVGTGSAATIAGPNFVFSLPWGPGSANSAASGIGNFVLQAGPGSASGLGMLNLTLGVSPYGDGKQVTSSGILATFAINLLNNSYIAAQGVLQAAVKVVDVTVWPFKLFVLILQEVQRIVADILGLPSSPPAPDSTVAPPDLDEDSELPQPSDVESRMLAVSAGEGTSDDAVSTETPPVAEAATEALEDVEATVEFVETTTEVIDETAVEPVDETLAEPVAEAPVEAPVEPVAETPDPLAGTEIETDLEKDSDKDLGKDLDKDLEKDLSKDRDDVTGAKAKDETADNDTPTRRVNPRRATAGTPSAGQTGDPRDSRPSPRTRAAERTVA